MDVKIGITDVAREVAVSTNATADDIANTLAEALANNTIFELEDEQGRRVLVPAAKIGYVDVGAAQVRQVGFGAV